MLCVIVLSPSGGFLPRPSTWQPGDRFAVFAELVRVLAALHRVDYARVGLAEFGRRGGYGARQLNTWAKQVT